MSYIRSGSNPERLYIYGASRNEVYIHYNTETYIMPEETWDGLNVLYAKFDEPEYINNNEVYRYKGASLTLDEKVGTEFKHILRYKDWEIPMWVVTWEYINNRYAYKYKYHNNFYGTQIQWAYDVIKEGFYRRGWSIEAIKQWWSTL